MAPVLDRRAFMKLTSTGLLVGFGMERWILGAPLVPGGVPTRILGKTGEKVSILAIGCGSRFSTSTYQRGEEHGVKILNAALDAGVNYIDTAASYSYQVPDVRGTAGYSERIVGQVVKHRRKEIFLATKTAARNRDAALKSVEQSLKNLQSDHIDLIQMHNLTRPEDIETIGADSGCLKALRELQAQKVVRFVGITCHQDGALLRRALERFELDTVLMALNAAQSKNPLAAGEARLKPIPTFESEALPTAVKKNLGIIAMKALGQKHLLGDGPGLTKAADLIRYNLSLPVSTAVVGIETLENLHENIQTCRTFSRMKEDEMNRLRTHMAPSQAMLDRFFAHHAD